VRQPHLDTLAIVPRLLKGFGVGKRAGDVAGTLIDAAGNLADRLPCGNSELSSGMGRSPS